MKRSVERIGLEAVGAVCGVRIDPELGGVGVEQQELAGAWRGGEELHRWKLPRTHAMLKELLRKLFPCLVPAPMCSDEQKPRREPPPSNPELPADDPEYTSAGIHGSQTNMDDHSRAAD